MQTRARRELKSPCSNCNIESYKSPGASTNSLSADARILKRQLGRARAQVLAVEAKALGRALVLATEKSIAARLIHRRGRGKFHRCPNPDRQQASHTLFHR